MADCSKTLEYVHELKRMCESSQCPRKMKLCEYHCDFVENIDQETINIVQKWSDENSELKACPFCGKTDSVYVDKENELYQVVCYSTRGGCGASSGYIDTKEEAIENWNKRSNDDLKDAKDEKK